MPPPPSALSILRRRRRPRPALPSSPSASPPRRFSTNMQARYSPGTDEPAAASALAPLLAPSGGRWTLSSQGQALERSFKFKSFAKAWDFMTAVSLQSKVKNHHPEWANVYNTAFVRWTTHNPRGLSRDDIAMASICDSIARDFGELDPGPASCDIKTLADQVTVSAGDCCTPKK
ncbi:uncharacterized protein UV8b_06800 [Ustilaginoidea virens]|uniref:4a-hydroxytetrahydrobiopterin dehydratase n=1 Tax=Ustilaginoidea virens TaxID=1159556 RepID=A0A8E5HWK1_USTVR|nr:uncharacterized protein UV8b_06800 [Ustilaginoidea virens]QUC22559.1 hypothetical protein UV8b_06800 [Ustilaginoidea virens]